MSTQSNKKKPKLTYGRCDLCTCEKGDRLVKCGPCSKFVCDFCVYEWDFDVDYNDDDGTDYILTYIPICIQCVNETGEIDKRICS